MAGQARPFGEDSDFALAAYALSGGLDEGDFGKLYLRTTDFNGGDYGANGLAKAPVGKFVAAGYAEAPACSARVKIAVARYTAKGRLTLDLRRRRQGDDDIAPGDDDDIAQGVVVYRKGRITVAGSTEPASGPTSFVLVRYRAAASSTRASAGRHRQDALPGQRFGLRDGDREREPRAGGCRGTSFQPTVELFAVARYLRDAGAMRASPATAARPPRSEPSPALTLFWFSPTMERSSSAARPECRAATSRSSATARTHALPWIQRDGVEADSISTGPIERIYALALATTGGSGPAHPGDDFAALRFRSTGGSIPPLRAPRHLDRLRWLSDSAFALVIQPRTNGKPVLAEAPTRASPPA